MSRDLKDREIPDIKLLQTYYAHGEIDEGTVVLDDNGAIRFLGSGFDECWWNAKNSRWEVHEYEGSCCFPEVFIFPLKPHNE